MNFLIQPTSDEFTLDRCARMMSESEPWITLKRDYEGCRLAMRGDYKEVYVAIEKESSALLGFIVLQMAGVFKGYIQSICVAPNTQGTGLGTALIQFAEKRIFSESPNAFMLVSSFNERAFRLYTRLGYQKVGTLQDFVVEGVNEFLLRKTLGPLNTFQKKEK